jgi:hypothetical protein
VPGECGESWAAPCRAAVLTWHEHLELVKLARCCSTCWPPSLQLLVPTSISAASARTHSYLAELMRMQLACIAIQTPSLQPRTLPSSNTSAGGHGDPYTCAGARRACRAWPAAAAGLASISSGEQACAAKQACGAAS